MSSYKAPEYLSNAFHCPHCGTYAKQLWAKYPNMNLASNTQVDNLRIVFCSHCSNLSLWVDQRMVYPDIAGVPDPNPDLPDNIKSDYLEAAGIINKSPRGSAALLRLCIQKICMHLGEKGNRINDDIGNLVKKGLPPLIQQSLDAVRVIGNDAVHPGQIDLNDNRELALSLFQLVNLIADVMISQPKHVQSIYDSLPPSTRDAIVRRDT